MTTKHTSTHWQSRRRSRRRNVLLQSSQIFHKCNCLAEHADLNRPNIRIHVSVRFGSVGRAKKRAHANEFLSRSHGHIRRLRQLRALIRDCALGKCCAAGVHSSGRMEANVRNGLMSNQAGSAALCAAARLTDCFAIVDAARGHTLTLTIVLFLLFLSYYILDLRLFILVRSSFCFLRRLFDFLLFSSAVPFLNIISFICTKFKVRMSKSFGLACRSFHWN